MKKQDFWSIIITFNQLMKEAINGPDCTDPIKCKADCCSIKIDVPKILAEKYIDRSYALKTDFIRSNVFSFHLRFDEGTGKCFLFDKVINGCKVHFSGIKPPQCWIYPTNFTNTQKNIKCKKLPGWSIRDQEKASKAEKLLESYIFLCKLEARKELHLIKSRLNKKRDVLNRFIQDVSPSSIGGFQDSWDHIKVIPAEGISLQMKKFCSHVKKSCENLPDDFLKCKKICGDVANALINHLNNNLLTVLSNEELDYDGKIPLYKLLKYPYKKL